MGSDLECSLISFLAAVAVLVLLHSELIGTSQLSGLAEMITHCRQPSDKPWRVMPEILDLS